MYAAVEGRVLPTLTPEQEAKRAREIRRRDTAQHRAAVTAAQLSPATSDLGLPVGQTSFECFECGRLADTVDAWTQRNNLIARIGLNPVQFASLESASRLEPVRAAYVQRELRMTYEAATAFLTRAARAGLLDERKRGYVATAPRCAICYERHLEELLNPAPVVTSQPTTRDPIPPQLRFRVLQRDAFRCQYCGRSARDGAVLHLDHIVPVAAGGPTTEENLITACDVCNAGKAANPVLPT